MSKKVERDRVLGHEDESDGIQEYDNPLPDWWLGLLWGTIIFAVGYTVHYHFIADRSPQKALAHELAAAEARWPTPDVGTGGAAVTLTEAAAEAGEVIFKQNCVACHGAELKGGIGPSLVDDEWIHGGTPEQIHATIMKGVGAKGMPAWGAILGAEKVSAVTAYVVKENAEVLGRPFPPGASEAEPEHGEDEHGERSEGQQ